MLHAKHVEVVDCTIRRTSRAEVKDWRCEWGYSSTTMNHSGVKVQSSPVTVILLSFIPVNRLLYLWTCSLACCRLLFDNPLKSSIAVNEIAIDKPGPHPSDQLIRFSYRRYASVRLAQANLIKKYSLAPSPPILLPLSTRNYKFWYQKSTKSYICRTP